MDHCFPLETLEALSRGNKAVTKRNSSESREQLVVSCNVICRACLVDAGHDTSSNTA